MQPFQLVPKVDVDKPIPSDTEILDAIVSNNGIMMRVAGKLGITEDDIYRAVTRSARQLSTKLRAALMVQSYATMIKVTATLEANLEEMPADAVGRTYAATLAAFSNLAGQFEEKEEIDVDDDTTAGKEWMLERLDNMGKREALERATQEDIEQQATG